MAKHLKLQSSESVVVSAAAQIYAAYISWASDGGKQDQWMTCSIKEAIKIALATDDAIISDDEVESTPL